MATEQVQLGYSAKNIALSSKWNYRHQLLKKTTSFLRNVFVRATLLLKKCKPTQKETYGFKSSWEPNRLPKLKVFENSTLDLVENIEFHENTHPPGGFQKKLSQRKFKILT